MPIIALVLNDIVVGPVVHVNIPPTVPHKLGDPPRGFDSPVWTITFKADALPELTRLAGEVCRMLTVFSGTEVALSSRVFIESIDLFDFSAVVCRVRHVSLILPVDGRAFHDILRRFPELQRMVDSAAHPDSAALMPA